MKYLFMLTAVFLTACGSSTPYKQQDLLIDKHVQAMSRNEVISAVHECEGNGLRASMVYAKRQVNGLSVDVVIDVVCAPRFRNF
jgi:uncharacterized protein YcfL